MVHPAPTRPRVGDDAADRRLDALAALNPHPRRRALLAHAPLFTAIRFERIAIKPSARALPVSALPMNGPLRKGLRRTGRKRLGDLDGLTYLEVLGRALTVNQAMRQLHALLHVAGVIETKHRALFEIAPRVRGLTLDAVGMPRALRQALAHRGVKTLGQIAALTPARLGPGFGIDRWRELEDLVNRAPTVKPPPASFAHAVDAAMDRLPPQRRRALALRFGAEGRPITIKVIATRCGLGVRDPHRMLDRWTRALADDAGPAVARALHEVQARTKKRRARLTSDEVDVALGVTRSRPRYGRDFYLRLLRRVDPGTKFGVVWGKKVPRKEPARGKARGPKRKARG